MDLNARTLKSLEWERLKQFLSLECSSAVSRKQALSLECFEERVLIETLLSEAEEALKLFRENIDISQEGLLDLQEQLERLSAGASLAAVELLQVKRMLEMSRKLRSTVSSLSSENYPETRKLLSGLHSLDNLVKAIDKVVDIDASIRDDASPLLGKKRREVQKLNQQIKDELLRIINSANYSKCLQEPIFTIRNGRYVLPVLANMRQALEGIVHDSSSTGLTIYVEPKSVVELTNNIRISESEIEREIDRLLQELSLLCGKNKSELESTFSTLVEADLRAAKARLAHKYGGSCPRITDESQLKLLQARHPLLILQMGTIDSVVPNDLILNGELKTLIITGPNTGGKTVYLKTAGLLALMLKAGLLLPVAEGSVISIFSEVFADIGDEQSLEQNLSTFSSHMSNIIEICRLAGLRTLVLLDEIGAGTDPREGVILARVILSFLNEVSALCICSTHYGDLKTLAHSQSGFGNASMDFDEQNLKPSYRLRPGVAGNSKAIAVAARLGLAPDLVEKARHFLESEKENLEQKIDELEKRLRLVSEEEEHLIKLKLELEEKKKELEDKAKSLQDTERQLHARAAGQFEDAYRDARKIINELTASLQKEPSLARAQEARNKLERIKKELSWFSKEDYEKTRAELKCGQTVKVRSLAQSGILESLPGEEGELAQVRISGIKVKVKLDDLELSEPVSQKKQPHLKESAKPSRRSAHSRDLCDPVFVRSQRNTLDLRGHRVDEGLSLLDRFLDEAYLEQISPVMVIHGHGTGALKQSVREFLLNSSYPHKARPGEPYEGGDGVTVINFQ